MKHFFRTLLDLPIFSDTSRAQARYIFERLCPPGDSVPSPDSPDQNPVYPEGGFSWDIRDDDLLNAHMREAVSENPRGQVFDCMEAEALGALTLLIGRALEQGSATLSIEDAVKNINKIPAEIEDYYKKRNKRDTRLLAFVRNPAVQARLELFSEKLDDVHFLVKEAGKSKDTDFFAGHDSREPVSVLDLRSPLSDERIDRSVIDPAPDTPADEADPGSLRKPLVFSMGNFYFARYYAAETAIAKALNERLAQRSRLFNPDNPEEVSGLGKTLNVLFPKDPNPRNPIDWQKAAVAMAFLHPVTVVTGGPGTGKTTTVAKLLSAMVLQQKSGTPLKVGLAAPTGKAAARMLESLNNSIKDPNIALEAKIREAAQVTGKDPDTALQEFKECLNVRAVTLHTLLGRYPGSLKARHNERAPLLLDVLIVDEVSMVDILMMHSLLSALSPNTSLIMLGDHNQLTSVSAGTVLGDICRVLDAGDDDNDDNERGGLSHKDRDLIVRLTGIAAEDLNRRNIADGIVKLVFSRRFSGDSAIGQLARMVNDGEEDKISGILENSLSESEFRKAKEGVFWSGNDSEVSRQHDDHGLQEMLFKHTFPNSSFSAGSAEIPSGAVKIAKGFLGYFNEFGKTPELVLLNAPEGLSDGSSGESLEDRIGKIFKCVNDFRVLTPVHDGVLGDIQLNNIYNKKSLHYMKSLIKRKIEDWYKEQNAKDPAPAADITSNNEKTDDIFFRNTRDLDEDWYPGKVFLVTRNNRDWDLHNGDVAIAGWDPAYPGSRRIWVEAAASGDAEVSPEEEELSGKGKGAGNSSAGTPQPVRYLSLPFSMIPNLATGYVLTVHKSQGSEFAHTAIVIPDENGGNTSRELLYTAITRAKDHLSIYASMANLKKAVGTRTERASGLDRRLRIKRKRES
ncbi:MAG: AAA family ATPase [Succinimonas sp.]|nr:AAA family ATPase [Succinimonas sp.]